MCTITIKHDHGSRSALMSGYSSLFDDADRLAVMRKLRVRTDRLRSGLKHGYIWALYEYHVAGATDVPPSPPNTSWVDAVNESFERLVRSCTGISINVGRVFASETIREKGSR